MLKKLWFVLKTSEKRQFIIFVIFSTFVTFAEIFSVAIVIPFFGVLLNYDELSQINYFKSLLNIIGNPEENIVIIISTAIFILTFVIKNILIIKFNFSLNSFIFNLKKRISNTIFRNYINENYIFFIKNKSSKLISNINTEVNVFINNYFQQLLILFSELSIFIGLITVMVLINPSYLLIMVTISILFMIVLFSVLRKKIQNLGDKRQIGDFQKMSFLQQSFIGIKETKIYNVEEYLIKKFQYSNNLLINIEKTIADYAHIPKIYFEIILITTFSIFVLGMRNSNLPTVEIVSQLAVISLIGIRFLPMVNKLSNLVTRIKIGLPAFKSIYEVLSKIEKKNINISNNEINQVIFKNEMKIENVNLNYGKKTIFNNLNLKINKGTFIGIVGESGSGKTSFLDLILGLITDYEGKILLDNNNLKEINNQKNNIFSYVPQEIKFTSDKIKNNIAYGIEDNKIDIERVNDILKKVELSDYVSKLDNNINTELSDMAMNMSGGQRQRLGIARALYFNPKILILDEATSALDLDIEKKILDMLIMLKGELTLITTSHRESSLKICDEIYRLKNFNLEKEK